MDKKSDELLLLGLTGKTKTLISIVKDQLPKFWYAPTFEIIFGILQYGRLETKINYVTLLSVSCLTSRYALKSLRTRKNCFKVEPCGIVSFLPGNTLI